MNKNEFRIRKATADDAAAIAALHVATFNETHGFNPNGPTIATRQGQWENLFRQNNGSWFCYVVENAENKLVGFTKGQHYDHADLPEFSGELNKIYLLRQYHRQGVGRRLLCATANQLMEMGVTSMVLFGDAKNPSNGFYERMGAEKIFSKKGEFHGGYGWKSLKILAEHCGAKELRPGDQ